MEEDSTDVDKDIFKVKVSKYVTRCNRLRANLEESYTLVLGKCTDINRIKLEGLPEWETTYDNYDVIKLLKMIKSLAHQATNQK